MTSVSTAQQTFDADFIDLSVIESLSSIMTESAVQSLLVDMERDVRERLMRLSETKVAEGSMGVIAQDSHDLRSMGGNFGLVELAQKAGIVERAARGQCLDTVRTSTPTLISTGYQSLKALNSHPIFRSSTASRAS